MASCHGNYHNVNLSEVRVRQWKEVNQQGPSQTAGESQGEQAAINRAVSIIAAANVISLPARCLLQKDEKIEAQEQLVKK